MGARPLATVEGGEDDKDDNDGPVARVTHSSARPAEAQEEPRTGPTATGVTADGFCALPSSATLPYHGSAEGIHTAERSELCSSLY
jgi:hypothetical protein